MKEKLINQQIQNNPAEALYHIALNGNSWKKDVRGADSQVLTNSISHDIDPRERKATYKDKRRKESMDFESLRDRIGFKQSKGDMDESMK